LVEDNNKSNDNINPNYNNNEKKIRSENNEETVNSFKNKGRNNNKRNSKEEKEKIVQELLNVENFPSLETDKTDKTDKIKVCNLNFINKIQLSNKDEKNSKTFIDPDLENLKPGWIISKKDQNTGKIIMKSLHGEEHLLHPENVHTNKFDLEISRDIPKALVNLYEKRTKEYIETYGEYAWEKMFKRPNWREEELENTYDSDDEEYEDEDEEYEYE
jgi:hypothetical protein